MVPHFAIPFRVDSSGAAAVVDQDSFQEIAQCCEVLFLTTPGERIELPEYGVPNQVFLPESLVDTSALSTAVKKWEPRATALIESTAIDETLRHLLIEIETSNDLLAGHS